MSYTDVRRKLAQQRQQQGQKPIQGSAIPAHLRQQLNAIKVRCAENIAARTAKDAEPPAVAEEGAEP